MSSMEFSSGISLLCYIQLNLPALGGLYLYSYRKSVNHKIKYIII